MPWYDLRDYWIDKLFEEHAELVDANRLEGEDPDICKWLKKRHRVIKKFDKKLQKAEDQEDYRSSRIERLIDILEELLYKLIS